MSNGLNVKKISVNTQKKKTFASVNNSELFKNAFLNKRKNYFINFDCSLIY